MKVVGKVKVDFRIEEGGGSASLSLLSIVPKVESNEHEQSMLRHEENRQGKPKN